MITAFEIVIFAVAGMAILVCFTPFFNPIRAIAQLGRQGALWIEHQEDRTDEEQPDADAIDAALPTRALRARH